MCGLVAADQIEFVSVCGGFGVCDVCFKKRVWLWACGNLFRTCWSLCKFVEGYFEYNIFYMNMMEKHAALAALQALPSIFALCFFMMSRRTLWPFLSLWSGFALVYGGKRAEPKAPRCQRNLDSAHIIEGICLTTDSQRPLTNQRLAFSKLLTANFCSLGKANAAE